MVLVLLGVLEEEEVLLKGEEEVRVIHLVVVVEEAEVFHEKVEVEMD